MRGKMKRICHLLFGILVFGILISSGVAGSQQTCDPPDIPEQGSYNPNQEEYELAELVIYKCKEGFILSGMETSRCLSTGFWSNPSPFCDAKVDSLECSGIQVSSLKRNVMSKVTDNSTATCVPLAYQENITISLVKKISLVAVRLFFGTDSFLKIDIDKCIHPTSKQITHKDWESFKCDVSWKTNPVDKIQIKINNTEGDKSNIYLCEVELYEKEDGCDSSPSYVREVSNGYFNLSRTRAELNCKDGYTKSKNSKLSCEKGIWRGKDIFCERKWRRSSIYYSVITVACAIIIVLFAVILYFVRKQRNREVVVVYNPPNMISMPEQDYASVYYDTMPVGVPLPPTSSRPPGPMLNVEYVLPADAKQNIRHKSLPTEVTYDRLKASPIYEN